MFPSLQQPLPIIFPDLHSPHGLFICRVRRCLIQPNIVPTFQGADDKSHKPDRINFSCPHVTVPTCQPDNIDNLSVLESPCVGQNMFPILFQGGIAISEIMCGDGFWHIDRCPHNCAVQCSTLQKNISAKCTCKINTHKMTSRTRAPRYSGFWV